MPGQKVRGGDEREDGDEEHGDHFGIAGGNLLLGRAAGRVIVQALRGDVVELCRVSWLLVC